MRPESPESPELRRDRRGAVRWQGVLGYVGPGSRLFETTKRVVVGVFADGFLHAGNLAYLTLLTLFPFFIVLAAVAQAIGRPDEIVAAMDSLLVTLPAGVRDIVNSVAREVLSARTGSLLWLGAGVGLWTITSYIETIRDILRRAYGTGYGRPFWHYRLAGIVVTVMALMLIMFSFSAKVFLTAAEELVFRFIPQASAIVSDGTEWIAINIGLFVGLFAVFWALTPQTYRAWRYPKWPGALFVTLWWSAALNLLPKAIAAFGGYEITYGSLAGVIVALLFFWIVGFGLVIGAHINAALANPGPHSLEASTD